MKQVIALVMSMPYASFYSVSNGFGQCIQGGFFHVTDEFENGLEKSSYLVFNPKVIPSQQHLE